SLAPALAGGGSLLFGRLAGLLQHRAGASPLAMGLLLGLLPCGLVYAALIAAAALGSPLRGGAGLALFGLGTVPALLGVSVADELLVRHRHLVNRLSQVVILAMGLWFTWKGLAGF
ncbi:MAG: sulfite exporter TauE/SafE family protein, partial [Gemmatimonadota bacterium]